MFPHDCEHQAKAEAITFSDQVQLSFRIKCDELSFLLSTISNSLDLKESQDIKMREKSVLFQMTAPQLHADSCKMAGKRLDKLGMIVLLDKVSHTKNTGKFDDVMTLKSV